MSIIETLLNSLQADAPVRQVLVGAFWTAVVLDTDLPRCDAGEIEDYSTGLFESIAETIVKRASVRPSTPMF